MRNMSLLAGAVTLAACNGDGASTREIEQAAVDRARQELQLAQDIPLKATVWTGREADGELTYCGSVSGADNAPASVRPQQFAAHADPIRFFIFGDAHQTDPRSQPGKFEGWAALCAGAQST